MASAFILVLCSTIGLVAAHTMQARHRSQVTVSKQAASTAEKPQSSRGQAPTTTQAPSTAPSTSTGSTTPTATPQPKSTPPTLDQLVASINQQLSRYGVNVTLSPPNNASTYVAESPLTSTDVGYLQQFSPYLTGEFSKYPTDLVKNSGLKTIGLVKSLSVNGQARAAAPAPSVTAMFYDVDSMAAAGSAYAREVVSHEYWHYLDYKTHGSYSYGDSQWTACNPAGFTYGAGGATAYGPNSGYVAAFHPRADFITTYSEYAIEEDRAEMFGWLMYDPASVKGLNDAGVNCKINRLTTLVHQLSPSMSF